MDGWNIIPLAYREVIFQKNLYVFPVTLEKKGSNGPIKNKEFYYWIKNTSNINKFELLMHKTWVWTFRVLKYVDNIPRPPVPTPIYFYGNWETACLFGQIHSRNVLCKEFWETLFEPSTWPNVIKQRPRLQNNDQSPIHLNFNGVAIWILKHVTSPEMTTFCITHTIFHIKTLTICFM